MTTLTLPRYAYGGPATSPLGLDSAEINKIVVKEVVSSSLINVLHSGQRLAFTGAAEVAEDATEQGRFGDLIPGTGSNGTYLMLPVVPIRISIVE